MISDVSHWGGRVGVLVEQFAVSAHEARHADFSVLHERISLCVAFVGRVAGNVVNDDMLGSMEFACGVSGAKVVLVLGHTACGAVKGAIDDVEFGNLTGLLARIKPAITATKFDGEKSSKNASYVDAVARTNVVLGLGEIRRRSTILEDLEKKGTIKITGAMYDLSTGNVEFVG